MLSGQTQGKHPTRSFKRRQDLHRVLSCLLSRVRSLKQVLNQLAAAHVENRPRAFDDHGDHAIGSSMLWKPPANSIDDNTSRRVTSMTLPRVPFGAALRDMSLYFNG